MKRPGLLFWAVLAAAASILTVQVLIPPIVGLADQSDFRRVIGTFGYGPEIPGLTMAYVAPKYVRDPAFQAKDWEQPTSEYIFVGAAVLINKVISRDGKFDIRVMGAV